jgi:hypothetical protein
MYRFIKLRALIYKDRRGLRKCERTDCYQFMGNFTTACGNEREQIVISTWGIVPLLAEMRENRLLSVHGELNQCWGRDSGHILLQYERKKGYNMGIWKLRRAWKWACEKGQMPSVVEMPRKAAVERGAPRE